jgi:AraC-like DNA-binding protein
MSEIEVVQYNEIEGMTAFFNNVAYRSAHLHSEWELVWIIENSMGIKCDGVSFVANEGELVLFSPSLVHEFKKVDKSCTFMCLQVSPRFLGLSNLLVSESVHPADFLSSDEISKVRSGLLKMMKRYVGQDDLYQPFCKGQCALLMHMILSKMPLITLSDEESFSRSRKNERLVRLINFVDANYMHKIKLYDFAQAEGVTLCYMSHFIQSCLGQSFLDYLTTVRFNHACSMIARGNMKLAEIYKACGFSDYKYFVKTFYQKCGKTPEEYSKNMISGMNRITNNSLSGYMGTEEKIFDRDQSTELLSKLGESRRKVC